MSVGAYLSTKTEQDNDHKHKQIEYFEVENMPKTERQEIKEIFQAKEFEGDLLDQVVEVITSDKEVWVETMMKDELEMIKEEKSPFMIGGITYISFVTIGLIPLMVYVIDYIHPFSQNLFLISSFLTAIGFVIIGWMKAYVTETKVVKGIFETLILGAIAALFSYYVGDLIEGILSN